ncbi:MAG TPA: hypothetical protein VEC36_06805 [Patescibacteria group bacterium]|nr:hypothetical protein [Patescibacteria group bacterium]
MNRKFYPLSFLFAFLFAVAFWGYVNLNSTYTTLVETSLNVQVARGRAIEDVLPESLWLRVRGTGYQLVTLLYFSQKPQCRIDLSPRPLESSRERYVLTQDSLRRGIATPMNVQVLDISPPTVSFRTDVEVARKVPVHPNVDLNFRRGFTLITDLSHSPDSIEIRGTQRIVQSISSWPTVPMSLDDVHQPFVYTLNLRDSLRSTVRKSAETVRVEGNVQQVAELTFHDIPVEINAAPPDGEHVIRPTILTITIRGGIRQLQYMTKSMIRASIQYYDLMQDSTGYVKPTVTLPPDIQLVSVTPRVLRHTIVKKVLTSELKSDSLRLLTLDTRRK